jgi:replicative DNA helicase Mcm
MAESEERVLLENLLHSSSLEKKLRKAIASGQKSVVISYDEIVEFNERLAKFLMENPKAFFYQADSILEGITSIRGTRLRVRGLDRSVDIKDLRAKDIGRFIQIEGILAKASDIRPEIRIATFRCKRCGEMYKREQLGDYLIEPLFCENPNCKAKGTGAFELVLESTEFCDWQSLGFQDPPSKLRGGRMPKQLSGIVRDDFVDRAVPGDYVIATGYLQPLQEFGKKKKVLDIIFMVNHLEIPKKGVEEAELSPEDEQLIKEMIKDPEISDRIVQSIAPSISGHEVVKEAIALQLFGSDPVELPDGTRIRGDIHILLSGDPGTAKSQLLNWVSNVAPRGVYTSGMKSTGAGLTATAVRDEIGKGWMLEAGALVIADGGLAAIDEFEKMDKEDSASILESMEQQTISIAKAGIVARLNTRAAVLAATNPKGGRFDPNINFASQIPLDPVILSRFDLIFILRDDPKEVDDSRVTKHVISLHSKPKSVKAQIQPDLLRKMIIYARKNIHPTFTDREAQQVISDFYTRQRKLAAQSGHPLPMTVRQLESMIRLAKAHARLRFSQKVTVEDARKAISLVDYCLRQVGVDVSTGLVDIDTITTGIPKSQRDKMMTVLQIIEQLEKEYGGAAPIEQVKRMALSQKIDEDFVEWVIETEKNRGILYSPREGMIARVK